MPPKHRYLSIDILRFIAITLMVIVHFIWDLKFAGLVDWKTIQVSGIKPSHIIILLFLFCMGNALYIVHEKRIRWKKWIRRSVQLAFFAGVISLITYFVLPTRWVFFGILHCIFLCNIVGIAFIRLPWLALLGAIGILIWHLWGGGAIWWRLGPSVDYIPFFPWFAVALLGIASAKTKWYKTPIPWLDDHPNSKIVRTLKWVSTNSLWIYLIHQPVLFGLVMGAKKLVE